MENFLTGRELHGNGSSVQGSNEVSSVSSFWFPVYLPTWGRAVTIQKTSSESVDPSMGARSGDESSSMPPSPYYSFGCAYGNVTALILVLGQTDSHIIVL